MACPQNKETGGVSRIVNRTSTIRGAALGSMFIAACRVENQPGNQLQRIGRGLRSTG
jgi:hypothetical protein